MKHHPPSRDWQAGSWAGPSAETRPLIRRRRIFVKNQTFFQTVEAKAEHLPSRSGDPPVTQDLVMKDALILLRAP